MATVMRMHWAGISKQDYDAVRRETNFEGQKPTGGKYHMAFFESGGLSVVDVWESPKDFQHFVETRLMPAAQKLGLQGQPKVEFFDAHNTFAPNP